MDKSWIWVTNCIPFNFVQYDYSNLMQRTCLNRLYILYYYYITLDWYRNVTGSGSIKRGQTHEMHKLSNCITWMGNKLSDWGSTIDGHVCECVCSWVQLLHNTNFTFVLFKRLTRESRLSWHTMYKIGVSLCEFGYICILIWLLFLIWTLHIAMQCTHIKYKCYYFWRKKMKK